jgi:hypothetical protein
MSHATVEGEALLVLFEEDGGVSERLGVNASGGCLHIRWGGREGGAVKGPGGSLSSEGGGKDEKKDGQETLRPQHGFGEPSGASGMSRE